MAVVVYCPACQSKIRASDNVMGRQIKCPKCQTLIAVTANPSPGGATEEAAEGEYSAPPPRRRSSGFVDFLVFRRMITPIFIQIMFWLLFLACILGSGVEAVLGVILILQGDEMIVTGIALIVGAAFTLFIGPFIVRIYCEIMILFFRMNETLTDIKNTLETRR